MRVTFFWKCSKFNLDLKNAKKQSEKGFCFWDKSIWTGCVKLSLPRKEYLSSTVGVLTSSLKIFHFTKTDFFQLNYVHTDQLILQRRCRWDWLTVLVRLPYCLSRGPLKQVFLDIYLTLLSESVIWEIHKLWGSSLFENFQNLMYFWKIDKTVKKNILVFVINASEFLALNYL